MHRLTTGGVLADPGRAIGLARTVLGATKVDQGFTPQELVSLSSDLSRLPAAQTEFTVVPVAGFNPVIEGVGTTLEWDEAAAEKTFATLDQDRTLTLRDSTVQPSDLPGIGAETAVRGNTLACS
ncbi:hypothetical protein ACIHCV_05140 [Streptomyces sp. NPDC051956]|uniref:hypothetical protein n=1 Tax=Streptomyces sp. NPDC051956 TaxID=3365677 RepID=UPI0037D4C7A4